MPREPCVANDLLPPLPILLGIAGEQIAVWLLVGVAVLIGSVILRDKIGD
jgi:hypothetical protein